MRTTGLIAGYALICHCQAPPAFHDNCEIRQCGTWCQSDNVGRDADMAEHQLVKGWENFLSFSPSSKTLHLSDDHLSKWLNSLSLSYCHLLVGLVFLCTGSFILCYALWVQCLYYCQCGLLCGGRLWESKAQAFPQNSVKLKQTAAFITQGS